MEKMRHKCKLPSSANQDNSNDPPRKQAKLIGATITENPINGDSAESSNVLGTNSVYQLMTNPHGREEVQVAKQDKETVEANMLDSVRALLTCAICLEVDNHSNQCINGHIICSSCSLRLMQQTGSCRPKCPSCRTSLRLGLRRCLLAEQLADELPTQCFYCNEKVLRRKLHNHEVDMCPKRPAQCRFHLVGCTWKGLGEEVQKHAEACHFGLKPLGEIEPLLVDNISRQVAYNAETRFFTNGLLSLLKKSPYGLNIHQRQVGVFRDTSDEVSQTNESQTYKYISENSLLQFSGLRKIVTEVEVDLAQNKLHYRLLNKSEGKACLSVRLCSMRCGDMEFHVYDQIHNVNFDDSQKETQTYSALITCDSGVDNNNQDRKRLDSLIFKCDLTQLRPNVIQRSNLLVLDFILLCHRRERMDIQFDESNLNNPTAIFAAPFRSTVMQNLNNEVDTIPEEATEVLTPQYTRLGSSYNSLRSFLREMVQSPGSNILRPLISLISSQESNPVNNNTEGTQHSRPRTTVITVTSLNRRGTTNLESTNAEDDDDYDGLDSEESTAEVNQEESNDSSSDDDDSSESNTRLGDEQLEDRNNNALTREGNYHSQNEAQYSNALNKETVENLGQPSGRTCYMACRFCTHCYGNAFANNNGIDNQIQDGKQNQATDEQGNIKRNPMKRNRRETTKSPSLMLNTPIKRVRQTHTMPKTPKYRLTKTGTRRRPALIHERNSEIRSPQTGQDSTEIALCNSDSPSHEVAENIVNRNSNDTCCRTPLWLEKVLRTVSQVTRYFIRSHLLLSPNDTIVPSQADYTPTADYASQAPSVDSSSTISYEAMESNIAPTNPEPSPSVNSASTLLMSLRGDIPGEIIRLARTVTNGLIPVWREQVGDNASATAAAAAASLHVDSIPIEKNNVNNDMNNGKNWTQRHRKKTVYRNKRQQR